jgi:hypothetical protein
MDIGGNVAGRLATHFFRLSTRRALVCLAVLLAAASAVSCSQQSDGDAFFSTTSSGDLPSLAVSEAIRYPTRNGTAEDGFSVSVMLANLYYSADGSLSVHPYDFSAIAVTLEGEDGVAAVRYSVDLSLYAERGNGIPTDTDLRSVSVDDYLLVYAFNLASLFPDSYEGRLTFRVAYTEEAQSGALSFGKTFGLDFAHDVSSGAFFLSGFDWDYFG